MRLPLHLPFRIPESLQPRVWWLLLALVLAQWTGWIVWLTIAAHHSVADVPLASGAGP